MARIFISHSSKDKEFVRKLSDDLRDLGHQPWLDEWDIKVGDCIETKVEHGIAEADYVVVVLSANSVASNWVSREWKIKYWDEIESDRTLVLPVLTEDCEIPGLIKTKKYADFRTNYSIGLVQLAGSINPTISKPTEAQELTKEPNLIDLEISSLIAKIQSKSIPLSQGIAEALAIAKKANNAELEVFCRNELSGFDSDGSTIEKLGEKPSHQRPSYRLVEGYISYDQLNMQYIGWGEDTSSMLSFMRDSDDFLIRKIFISSSVSRLENQQPSDPKKQLITMEIPAKRLFLNSDNSDVTLFVYFSGFAFINLLETIRTKLTQKLLNLLPEVQIETADSLNTEME